MNPKQYLILAASLTLFTGAFLPAPGNAARNALPKNSVALSQSLVLSSCVGGMEKLAATTLAKGRKKHLVVADVTFTVIPTSVPSEIFLSLLVNNQWMQPFGDGSPLSTSCSSAGLPCTLSGTFWLDLDEAEAAYPGAFIKKPLNVEVWGGESGGPPCGTVWVTTNARLQKK